MKRKEKKKTQNPTSKKQKKNGETHRNKRSHGTPTPRHATDKRSQEAGGTQPRTHRGGARTGRPSRRLSGGPPPPGGPPHEAYAIPAFPFPPPAAWPCLTPRPHSTCGPHVSSGSRAAWLVRVAERADQDAARLGWLFCGLAPPVIHIFAIWPPQVKVRSSSSTLVLWLEWNYIIISCSIIFFCARWPMWCEYSGVPMIS